MNQIGENGSTDRLAAVTRQLPVYCPVMISFRRFRSDMAVVGGFRATAGWLVAIALLSAVLSGAGAAPAPHASGSTAVSDEVTPPQIHQLLTLLADPKVEAWLKQQNEAKAAAGSADTAEESVSHVLDSRLGAIREHIVGLARTIPDLPSQFRRGAALISADLGQHGRAKILLLLAVFVGLGSGVEWLFRKATQRVRGHLDTLPSETVRGRLHLVGLRFAFAVGLVAAFALGSVGPFLAFDWPPLLREIVFGFLIAFLVVRVAIVVGHFLLAPYHHERFRIIPMDTVPARFWHRRLVVFVGLFVFGWVIFGLLGTLGWSLEGRQLVAYTLGLGLLAIALEAVWRRPVTLDEGTQAPSPVTHHFGRGTANVSLSVGIVPLWMLWVAHAMASFWLVLVVITLPLAIRITRRAVENLLRPPGSPQLADGPPSVLAVCLERGFRALLIIAAVAVLAWGWGVDLVHYRSEDTLFARLADGVLSAVVILLVADVLWHAIKAAIDRKLAEVEDLGQPNTEEARRRARLRTLLPIFRNVLFVVVLVFAAMMALAALGVQMGPLIAGMGVLGVAIGFGAQSLVRDVIAGMFYLLDDAFRVGEYIQSGNYKGTVESFSFRSVRLRHQRGAIYTVPFSLLGAVQNQSRDWVIDKLMVGITYDSDIDRARKLIKQVGLDLAKDPEFAPLILEPLKMQGVDAFGDFAVQIRMKMMTLPGENFVIRRKALAMIKTAFDANGIKFAFPTVQIAGDGEPSTEATAAIAQRALELSRPQAAE
jgi:small-conductance mechanosensitive channel